MFKKQNKLTAQIKGSQHAMDVGRVEALRKLEKSTDKLDVLNKQFNGLIESIPDTVLLKDKNGRKLVTDNLTKRLFKQHDLNWYGGTDLTLPEEFVQIKPNYASFLLQPGPQISVALLTRPLELYYQIQVDEDRRILGVEVLLRWRHPKHGLSVPGQLIPMAEQTGLIMPIGHWVLKAACRQIKLWQNSPDMRHVSITVNISASQFNHPDFVGQVCLEVKNSGINASLLKLALTESLMLRDISSTIDKMEALKALGIRFSMDNFGTGYSSWNYLKQLPIDEFKIDQLLIRDINTGNCDAMIVKTLIDMAGKLDIRIVASGVETEHQFNCLKQLGCPAYQGYLFGEPMPVEQFEGMCR